MRTIILLVGWLAGAVPAAAVELTVEQVAPGNYVHYGTHEERSPANLGDQANIGFIVGERCVAVVDTGGSLPLGLALREAIRRVTPLPVCYVVLTHVHPDHFFGAAAFRADAPEYVGHAELPRALAARGKFYSNTLRRDLGDLAEGSEVIVPGLLVADRLTLDLGNREVEVRAWPVAHTDNDLTVYDRQTQTLWASDLLFIDHTPVVDGSILGFVQAMQALAALPARAYVAGHGRSPLPWPAVLEAQRRYLERLLAQTRQALRERKTIQEAVEEVGYAEADRWVNFDLFHRRNVTVTYTELEWED
jgi:quinoprotein relay system zinc metallohydrolase 2